MEAQQRSENGISWGLFYLKVLTNVGVLTKLVDIFSQQHRVVVWQGSLG
jgi:hypothetical protein